MIMTYKDLMEKVNTLEKETELTECIYFGALKRFENVQKDLSKLDDVIHIRRVIRPFLIQWGMMGRVVGREGLQWEKLGETLRKLEKDFNVLRNKKLLTINFYEINVSLAIKNIYDKIRTIPYIGGQTCVPKILHLINPEIFVMWDEDIKNNYKKRNNKITNSSKGYLEFLKEVQKELIYILKDHQKLTGKELENIKNEIRSKYNNKTLSRIIDEYNWITAHPIKN